MERPPAPAPSPAFLPLGTVVGPWRVVAWAGQGVYGAVYRAVRVGQEDAEPVALKIALLPRDPRFPREAALLARMHHPSIPRPVDAGEWQHPSGTLHPYIAMEWIDGVPLYDQAREHPPDSQQVLRLLAQLAGALQALHSQGGLHRDVKGANVLVRRTDGRAFLTDFGSGTYAGAESLTPHLLPPGTPAYRSPEAGLFELRFGRDHSARYRAQPTDDLYALGVTACRLLTGEYPEFRDLWKDETGTWQLDTVAPPAALLHNPGLDPQLRAWILRLLSVRPEERGSAQELAEALERAAEPFRAERSEKRADTRDGAASRMRRAHSGRLWLAMAAGVALAVGLWWSARGRFRQAPSGRAAAASVEQPDAGTVGLGDSAAPASTEDASKLPAPERMTKDTLPEPQPGQTRPDAKGRCPRKRQVALNGACWREFSFEREECEEELGGQMFKGTCYVPSIPPKRRPSSEPVGTP